MNKKCNWFFNQIYLVLMLCFFTTVQAQQTHLLVDPNGSGGFEVGATFETNGWTVVNGSQVNKWMLGNTPTWFSGQGAFISNNLTTSSNTYSATDASTVHLYRDITFPEGVETVSISLDVFQAGESNFDNLLVYLIDNSIVPSLLPTSGSLAGHSINPTWEGFVNDSTGYFLTRVIGNSTATQANIQIQLNQDQISYVSNSVKRLVFTWRNDGSVGNQPPASIDNVKVEAFVPLCYMVSNLSTQVTATSLTASWTVNPESLGYVYEVRTSGLPGTGESGLIAQGNLSNTVSTFTVNDLFGNTSYRVYVKQNCSESLGSSSWNYVDVLTLCGISGQFIQDFENVDTGSTTNPTRPTCWGYIDSGSGYAFVNTSAQYDSNRGYYMYNSNDLENDLILVSPQTNNLGNGGYRIRFRAKTTTSAGTNLQIVTLANQDNTNGFTLVETIDLTTSYDEYIVYLPQGTNDYFGFKHGNKANYHYIYIDDVVYEPIPACPNVLSVGFENATQNTVTISWVLSPGLNSASNLVYEVRTSGEPGSGTEGLHSTGQFVVSALNGVISGLESATYYTIYVKAVCTESGFDGWKQVLVVTECDVFTAINENFDTTVTGSATENNVPLCWSFIDSGVGSGYVSTSADFSLPNGYYINNAADTSGTYILVSPQTNNLGNGEYRVKFKAKKQYSSENTVIDFVTLSNPENTQGMIVVQEIPLTGTFQEFIVYLPEGTNDYFGFKHRTTSNTSPIFIDDVIYEQIPSCVEVSDLEASINYSNSSVFLDWQNPPLQNLSNQFEIQFGLENFELGEGTIQTVTGLSKEITGLTIGEVYQFYVRRVCSTTEQSVWVGPVTVLLDYCVSNPTSNDNSGISQLVFGEETFEINDVTYVDLTEESIEINSEEEIVSSITFATGYTYDTHIWIDFNKDGVFDNTTEKVFTGVSTNTNPTTLNTSFTIQNVYESGLYRVRIGTADNGQFTPNPCYSGGYGVTIDLVVNISFPCLVPEDLEVSDISLSSAILSWSAAGSNYNVEYGPQGFQPGNGTLISDVDQPLVLNDLSEATNYSFYVKQVCVDGESGWSSIKNFRTLCSTAAPQGTSIQTLVEDDFLYDIVVNGQNLKYYLDAELTQQVPAATVLSEGIYYITQTIGCESDVALAVYVQLLERIDEPVLVATQEFCGETVLSSLSVQGLPGATIQWYSSLTSSQVLTLNTQLTTGIYYVNQTDGITTSHRVPIHVIVNEIPVDLVSQTVLLCGYSNYGSLNVGQLEGTTMRWYTSLTASTPIANNQQVVTGTYYVTQSFGICESNRIQITVNAFEALPAPIAAIQTFCGSAVASQLVAQGEVGAELKWFRNLTSSEELNPSEALVTGTYYVEQHKNGCVSPRRAVAVRVVSITAPTVNDFVICGSGLISDLIIPSQSGVTYKWYNSPNSPTELSQTTELTTRIYYVSRVHYGCESLKTPVQVTVQNLPSSPTGLAIQEFIEGSTVADLLLDQTNVIWYISYNDSQNGTNPLNENMPLVNGNSYFAVIISENGCASLPFVVTVSVYLSNNEFDSRNLSYYPNPVVDLLTVSYSEDITSVKVFDLLGKQVKSFYYNESEIKLDFSDLPSGTYMVQLNTVSKQQFIKVVKK